MIRAAVVCVVALFILSAALLTPNSPSLKHYQPEAPAAKKTLPAFEPKQVGHPTFVSPHSRPIAWHDGRVFVVNTPADTVDIVDSVSRKIVARVSVGVDPVSIAIRPDGAEAWVTNHISDSVSVIDIDAESSTYLNVIATIQDFDSGTRATRFDEPVGIAFANNKKAYVALSSENKIAVIDVATRNVINNLSVPAQDPRAMVVRGQRLYVLPFESNNKTQLSGGTGALDGDLYTFNAWEHSVANNNVLSLGAVVDIVKHPRVPDRDLFVFDTNTDRLIESVDTLGTLLYGLTVNSQGDVFIAQTDARNHVNGRAGTKKHGLGELQNRAFLNQVTKLVASEKGSYESPSFIELEPVPPEQPQPGEAVATPFAVQVSDDDSTLFVSAAGSDKLITLDCESGKILGRVATGAVPRGIAIENGESGTPRFAWVLNAIENSVSLIDVSDRTQLKKIETLPLEDPTHSEVKRGRIAFNTAAASSTGTFACASCHPDGHTDQLLWVLKTPIVTGGNQIMPRSTMPVRGLRDTAPYHWDGIPGDPYGGNNSANVHGSDPPNSSKENESSTTRHLIDGGLASTMLLEGDAAKNDEGKAGLLTAAERDAMAAFLLSVPYPPAQRRAYTNEVSDRARRGFRLFHIEGDNQGDPTPNVCGNCHRMPFLVSTNTPGSGMDAPTWRGAYDRFLILPQGRLNIIDFDFYERVAQRGAPERNVWQFSWAGRRRFDPVWDMVLEGSTGFSGAFARQFTLNQTSHSDQQMADLWNALEQSAAEGGVVFEAEGAIQRDENWEPIKLQYFDGLYFIDSAFDAAQRRRSPNSTYTRKQLASLAANGKFIATLTARHGAAADIDNPQPALWTRGPLERQSGRQRFPVLHQQRLAMTVSGRHIDQNATILVDGRLTDGDIEIEGERIRITLARLPEEGMRLLQLQNPSGLFSNDFIFHVTRDGEAAHNLQRLIDAAHVDARVALSDAAMRGDIDAVKRVLARGADINSRRPQTGTTALNTASLRGDLAMVKFLIQRGARVNYANSDGNTPLHSAAFLCHFDIVEVLTEKGALIHRKNDNGESSVDVVTGQWNETLARFYQGIGRFANVEIDLKRIQQDRPKMVKLLRRDN